MRASQRGQRSAEKRPAKRSRAPHKRQTRRCAIANPSLPSPAGDGPARRARVTSAKRFAVRCQRSAPQQTAPHKTHSDVCWPIPAGMGRKIPHPRKKDFQKPHPFSVLRAAAPRNQRCDETRRPAQRNRPPHRRKKQNTRVWKFFLAVPTGDGPARHACVTSAKRFAVRCQRSAPQPIPPRKTHSDVCWPIPAGMGRKIPHPRKKDFQKPHPFSVLRAAAPRNQRCDETRRPAQRNRPPHRRKKQNTRVWKFFLAVPSGDGPARRARVSARPHEAPRTEKSAKFAIRDLQFLPRRPPLGTAQRAVRASLRGRTKRRAEVRRPVNPPAASAARLTRRPAPASAGTRRAPRCPRPCR